MIWLKRALWALLALLLAVVAAAGVYVWRTQPQLGGERQVRGLTAPVTIARDTSDVTHITTTNERDSAFGLGWVHAQERGWQLEFNRRVMHGELSAFLGKDALETDKLMRTLGIMRAAQQQFATLPAEFKDLLQAYADGINAFNADAGQALPPEFHVLGIKPGLWTPQDSMGWSLMMAIDLGGNWGGEIARLSGARVLDTQRLWQVYPVYEGEKPAATVDLAKLYRELGVYAAAPNASTGPTPAASAAASAAASKAASKAASVTGKPIDLAGWEHVGEVDGAQFGLGSNNWVVAGSRTASGKPLLANDPHLGLTAPAIWYFARLKTPSADVIGATLPGLPGVVLGRNAKVAWGFTNTGPDVQDVYIERINPANPSQYATPDGFANFSSRQETIEVKGLPPVVITVRESRHGPVLTDSLKAYGWIDTQRYALALRFAALDPDNHTLLAGWRAAKAQSVTELIEAYRSYHSPMQNVVMADSSGQVAFKAVGKSPIRKPGNDIMGLAPAPGWDAKYDWDGWLAYDQTPAASNAQISAKGWHATANQRIHPAGFVHFMGQDWAPSYRFERAEQLLGATAQHDAASMQAAHGDVKSLATVRLLKPFVASVAASNLSAPLKTGAASWDGTMAAQSPYPLLFAVWAEQLTRAAVEPRLGVERFKAQFGRRQFRATLEHMFEQNDPFWCGQGGCAALSAKALGDAVAQIEKQQGTDSTAWNWGQVHVANSNHNPFGRVPMLSKAFNVQVPTGGDGFTLNVGAYDFSKTDAPYANRHAASLRAVYDLADLEKSQFIYQTGQSGLVWSPRYRDMSATWAAVQYRALQLNPGAYNSSLVIKP